MPSIGIARTQLTGASSSGGGGGASGDWLSVKDFGALGSGTISQGGMAITAGTDTLTDTENAFWTLGNVGQTIMVAGAGLNGTDLWTTIASFISANQITLTANALSTVVAFSSTDKQYNAAVWNATDDTVAIQACVDAAAAASIGVYFPPGVYIYSSSLVQPVTISGGPSFMFGEPFASYLVAQDPGIAPYSGFLAWTSTVMSMRFLVFIGGSWDRTTAPTTGTDELTIDSLGGQFQSITVSNTVFLNGLHIHSTFGYVNGCSDCARSFYETDNTVIQACVAAGFKFGGPDGAEGGCVMGCTAFGDWPLSYCFDFDSQGLVNYPPTLINCQAFGGEQIIIPVGFNLPQGVGEYLALNCNTEGIQTSFVLGTNAVVRDSYTNPASPPGTFLVSFVVSNGELPYPYGTAVDFFLGQEIIDSNGNYQQVTTPGTTSGAATIAWATSGTTTDGSVVWTEIANPGNTPVSNAAIENCNDTGSGAPISLYDIGTNTTLRSNIFVVKVFTTAPQYLQALNWVRVVANYTTNLNDETIFANAASQTITLQSANQIPGHIYTVKNQQGITNVVDVAGKLIDSYPSVQLAIVEMALSFKWDGAQWWIF